MANKKIKVVLVYGHSPVDIFYYPMTVNLGSTIQQVIEESPLNKVYPNLDYSNLSFAIYGRKEKETYMLREDDRIEVLRPRTYNPRKVLLRDKQINKDKE